MALPTDLPIRAFKTQKDFHQWLASHHASAEGLWVRIYKKDSGKATVTYAEALDEALCYGWIDGLKKSYDADSWIQRFTPRRARSVWSKINTQHIARLTKEGRMKAAGLAQVEAAKADGRWKAAYDSGRNATVPADFLRALRKDKKALAFFESLNAANRYAIIYRLQTAKKPETRSRRMEMILTMMAKGEKFHD